MKIMGAYILKCSDNSFYVGSSKDIFKRVEEHNTGMGANYTRKRRPVQLIYYEEYSRIDDAYYRELAIKKYSRAKKEALIKGDKMEFKKLSRGKDRI
ncbi:MAG: GIY-YIG nuclease family protein [Flavobacteriales bacterium]